MAITNFIPQIWSENLLQQLSKRFIAISHCTREYEGEIKEKGSVVKIGKLGAIKLHDYTKNKNMNAPEDLSDSVRELVIDRARYFNFQIDDIDRAQSSGKLMDAAMKNAANALANDADSYVFQLYGQAGVIITKQDVDESNIINLLLKARTELLKNDVYDSSDIVIEVSPEVAELILKAKINLINDNAEMLETGCIGSIAGSKIYVSNNVAKPAEEDGTVFHKCYVRTKRAIAFAEQLSEIEAYRPDNRFADAMKGLYLFGAKVVRPEEFVMLDLCLAKEPETV